MAAFAVGLTLLVGFTAGYGFLAWQLLFRPLPTEQHLHPRPVIAILSRALLAVLLAIGSLFLTIGGFWDEVWHRKYGLPFGEDLLWRPHMLIYAGLLLPPALAMVAGYFLLTRAKGSLRQRLRSDRPLGLLLAAGGFLLYSLPADPIWHIIYGEDISAWSLPHLVLMLSALSVALLGVLLLLSASRPRLGWKSLLRIPLTTAFSLVFFITGLSVMAQVLIGDFANDHLQAHLRPAWLLPAIVTALALFIGTAANHATRSYGAAAVTGLLTVGLRRLLILAFDFPEISAGAWLPLLPPLVALDVWYAVRAIRGRSPSPAPLNAAVSLVGVGASLWLIPRLYEDLEYASITLVLTFLMCWLAGSTANWLGAMVDDYLARGSDPEPFAHQTAPRLAWIAPALFGAAMIFIVYFVATASPPTRVF